MVSLKVKYEVYQDNIEDEFEYWKTISSIKMAALKIHEQLVDLNRRQISRQ